MSIKQTDKIEYSLADLPRIIALLRGVMAQTSIITLHGDLGAGKTTLIRALLQSLGVHDEYITSPTFTYMNIYTTAAGQTLCHFDLYRITSEEQFVAAGFDEYLQAPNTWCFIEWPDRIANMLALLPHCAVNIGYKNEEARIFEYTMVHK